MKDTIEKVFRCKVFDAWSGIESCGLISECEKGSLHISPDIGIVEIINTKGKECVDGEMGEIICTGFLNYEQPLIRYRIGDYAVKSDKTCNCGRAFPTIEEIVGRKEDLIFTPDGRELVRILAVFTGISEIKQGQIIQQKLDKFSYNWYTYNHKI